MHGYFRQDYLQVPDGARLYFQVQGEQDPPVVLCDGLGCDGFIWKYLQPELRRDHRVLRWHYRGHGKSTVPPVDRDRIGMVHTTEDLDRLMAHVGMGRSVIVGHSMGVQVALEFHRRYPQKVAGLVLICGSYGNPLDTFHDDTLLRRVFPFLRQTVERFPALSRKLVKLALSTELAVRLGVMELNRELVRRKDMLPYFDHLANMDPVVFVRTLHALAEHSGWEHLPHINVPTLIIGGDRDTFTPLWLSRRMADTIPGAELMIVPGGSHTTPLEQPSLVNERIARFLQQKILAPAAVESSGAGSDPRSPDKPAQVA